MHFLDISWLRENLRTEYLAFFEKNDASLPFQTFFPVLLAHLMTETWKAPSADGLPSLDALYSGQVSLSDIDWLITHCQETMVTYLDAHFNLLTYDFSHWRILHDQRTLVLSTNLRV